jgi:lysozyme
MNGVIDLVQQHEGLRLKPYLDTATPPRVTIGWGRNLTDEGISRQEAEVMLANDIAVCETDLEQFWWFRPLDQVRRAVLIDLRFNLGLSGLLHFPNMIAAIGKQDWAAAAVECADPHWVAQVGDRAHQDAKMLLTGSWPT